MHNSGKHGARNLASITSLGQALHSSHLYRLGVTNRLCRVMYRPHGKHTGPLSEGNWLDASRSVESNSHVEILNQMCTLLGLLINHKGLAELPPFDGFICATSAHVSISCLG